MVATPEDTPVTIPDVPTVATAVLLLVQVPPGVPLFNVVVKPVHTEGVPVLGTSKGRGFTVTSSVVLHPVPGRAYVMFVVPAAIPVTTPKGSILPVPGELLVHVPPPASVSVVVAPTQTVGVPEIADGAGSTVTATVVAQLVTGKV